VEIPLCTEIRANRGLAGRFLAPAGR